jgi:hypothetical protein
MMVSVLCMGCGKQYVTGKETNPSNSITNMMMVEEYINQIIKTQTNTIVISPTMMARCG